MQKSSQLSPERLAAQQTECFWFDSQVKAPRSPAAYLRLSLNEPCSSDIGNGSVLSYDTEVTFCQVEVHC